MKTAVLFRGVPEKHTVYIFRAGVGDRMFLQTFMNTCESEGVTIQKNNIIIYLLAGK
jgi:hypothetical protein